MYKVVLENDRVRVLEVRGKPGDQVDMHSHPPTVIVPIAGTQLRVRLPDGETREGELKTNDVRYLEAIEHATEIVGPEDLHMLVIELK
jgi:quercetin dioxygenase-like cupin family protein